MVFALDHAAGEGNADKFRERLLRPVRLRKCVRVAGAVRLISVDTFFTAARRLRAWRTAQIREAIRAEFDLSGDAYTTDPTPL